MSVRLLAALAAFGLLVGPAAADKKKLDHAPETGPEPRPVVAPPAMTLPSPAYIQGRVPQYFPDEPALPLTRELAHQVDLPLQANPKDTVLKTYAVADLVVPLPMAGVPTTVVPKTLEAELIRKITAAVEPKTWASAGGKASIDYFAPGMALVINATPKVHKAVGEYLDAERKMQDRQVVTEIQFITVSDSWYEKSGLAKAFAPAKGETKPTAKFCNRGDLETFLKSAKAESAIELLSSPKMTCLNGQAGRIRCGETANFLTGLSMKSVNGQLVYEPKNEAHELGIDLTIEPTISADGKSIKLGVAGAVREHSVLPVPTTSIMLPGKGTQAPFTHLLQEPKIVTRSVDDNVVLPDGGTALLYGGKATIQTTVRKTPVTEIPFLAAVMAEECKVTQTNHLFMMVTTRVIHADSGPDELVQTAGGTGKLSQLLVDYGRACRDGNVEEARRLALECLVLDPTCFAKK